MMMMNETDVYFQNSVLLAMHRFFNWTEFTENYIWAKFYTDSTKYQDNQCQVFFCSHPKTDENERRCLHNSVDFRLLNKSPWFVRLASGLTSDRVYTNTGGPQDTCLSPFLFTLYTVDCRSTHNEYQTDKSAADTAQIA